MFHLPWLIAAQTAQTIAEFWIDQAFPKDASEAPPEPQPEAQPAAVEQRYDWNALLVAMANNAEPNPFRRHPSDRWDNRTCTFRKASRKRRS
jgi:hypothetical protein